MAIYLACSIIGSILSIPIMNLTPRKRIAFIILVSLPFCLLAAVRDISIGTDTALYPWFAYRVSLNHSLQGLYYLDGGNTEPMFLATVWIVTRIFGTFSSVLFFIEALIIIPVAFILAYETPNYMPLGILMYGLVYFGFSLNIMRQMICTSFLLLAFVIAMKGRIRCALGVNLLACGFHATGVFGFALIAYYLFLVQGRSHGASRQKKGLSVLVTLFCIALVCVAFVFGRELLYILSQLKGTYVYQVEHIDEGYTSITVLVYGIVPYILEHFERGITDQRTRINVDVLKIVVLFGGIAAQLSVISPELSRIGIIFHFFSILLYPIMAASRTQKGSSLIWVGGLLVSFAFFILTYVRGGACEIIPYVISGSEL